MKNQLTYNKAAVQKIIEQDKFSRFRLNLLINYEKKTEDEALESIFYNQIQFDEFQIREYNKIKKALTQPTR